jgi:hypothetical protein
MEVPRKSGVIRHFIRAVAERRWRHKKQELFDILLSVQPFNAVGVVKYTDQLMANGHGWKQRM